MCGMTFCQRHAGSLALNYCCDVGIFAQCHVEGVDLNRFDADHDGQGVLEVSFCVTDPVARSMLHIWYGVYPFRKALPLVGTDAPDLALGPGCYVRYFSPQDARCAAFNPGQLPVSDDGRRFPAACAGPAPQFYTWPCEDGRWGSADPSCVFDYDQTPLWLTVENCVGRSSTTVSIESVNYLPADCDCISDDQCRGTSRPVCAPAHVASPSCSVSDPRCGSVCAVSR
jgi:hypothetical protein